MPREIKGIPGSSCINIDGAVHELSATDGCGGCRRNTDLTQEELDAAWKRAMARVSEMLGQRCGQDPELARCIYNMPDVG